jgi:hypothetical protein
VERPAEFVRAKISAKRPRGTTCPRLSKRRARDCPPPPSPTLPPVVKPTLTSRVTAGGCCDYGPTKRRRIARTKSRVQCPLCSTRSAAVDLDDGRSRSIGSQSAISWETDFAA